MVDLPDFPDPAPYVVATIMVRDEEAIIGRWARSVAPHVDAIMVLDTGCTDGTVDLLRETAWSVNPTLAIVVEQSDWQNFGHNRTVLADAARQYFRTAPDTNIWHLLVDADHTIEIVPNWRRWLTTGCTPILTLKHAGTLQYWVPRLIRADHHYTWEGVTHESVVTHSVPMKYTGIIIHDQADGSSHAVKYARDIELLTAQLKLNPQHARSWFYLGQSYRDMGRFGEASDAYQNCRDYSTWDEEIFYAAYQAALCHDGYNIPKEHALLSAYAMRPTRIEPLVCVARMLCERGAFKAARRLLYPHRLDPISTDILFVETDKWTCRDKILRETA